MSSRNNLRRSRRRSAGMTIIEIMIGLVIGLITVLIVYQVYNVSERYKRNTTTSGDAQTTGVYSIYTLAREIGNGGASLAVGVDDLLSCVGAAGAAEDRGWALRSLPALISPTGAGTDADSDTVTVYYGASNTIVTPAIFTATSVVGGTYRVQSPMGFNPAGGELVVAVNTGTGQCIRSLTTGVSVFDAAQGVVDVSLSGGAPIAMPSGAKLFNLGPQARVQRLRFGVDPATNSLTVSDLMTGAAPNPIASNVVLFKAQYGVDTDGDGVIDTWTRPVNPGPLGLDWTPGHFNAPVPADNKALAQQINRIKAVRIAVLVRGDEPDPALKATLATPNYLHSFFTQCTTGACPAADNVDVVIPQGPNWGWRYRAYETMVPLRNAIWNPVSP